MKKHKTLFVLLSVVCVSALSLNAISLEQQQNFLEKLANQNRQDKRAANAYIEETSKTLSSTNNAKLAETKTEQTVKSSASPAIIKSLTPTAKTKSTTVTKSKEISQQINLAPTSDTIVSLNPNQATPSNTNTTSTNKGRVKK